MHVLLEEFRRLVESEQCTGSTLRSMLVSASEEPSRNEYVGVLRRFIRYLEDEYSYMLNSSRFPVTEFLEFGKAVCGYPQFYEERPDIVAEFARFKGDMGLKQAA